MDLHPLRVLLSKSFGTSHVTTVSESNGPTTEILLHDVLLCTTRGFKQYFAYEITE